MLQNHEVSAVSQRAAVSAGKFDFDTRLGGVTSLNYEKLVIFGDMAIRSASKRILAEAPDEVPAWVYRVIDYHRAACRDRLQSCEGATVTNEEVSWEPFWARVETANGQAASRAHVTPPHGTLAPRGGADKYTDSCTFQIKGNSSAAITDDLFLVVRTEQESWVWQLQQ